MLAADHVLITTRGEFHDAVRNAIQEAATQRCREIFLCNDDFADWPLNEAALVENLVQWSSPHRKCVIVARGFDEIARLHPRFVAWRRTWSHSVECRINDELEAGQMPTLLLMPGLLTLRLVDTAHYRGSVSRHVGDAVRAREQFDAVNQRSQDGFPATQLGL